MSIQGKSLRFIDIWKQLYVQKQFKTQQNVVFYVIEKKYTHTGLEQHEEWFSGELSL